MISFSFLNQTLWCDPHWNRFSETIPMSGNIIGFGWEIRKLAFWKLSILDLICCPGSINTYFWDTDISALLWYCKQTGAQIRANISWPWSWHQPEYPQHCTLMKKYCQNKLFQVVADKIFMEAILYPSIQLVHLDQAFVSRMFYRYIIQLNLWIVVSYTESSVEVGAWIQNRYWAVMLSCSPV